MQLLDALNDSSVVFVRDLSRYWGGEPREGFEAISPTGEVRAFETYEAAQEWRMAEVNEMARA